MKIVIVGGAGEGKTRLLDTIRKQVLEGYGAECHISDGGCEDHIKGGGFPLIDILVTNDPQEAMKFLREEE